MPSVSVYLPARTWVVLEKIFFVGWPWGTTRSITVPPGAPIVRTRHYFSAPPFYYEGSASAGIVNSIWFPVGYNELYAYCDANTIITYNLG